MFYWIVQKDQEYHTEKIKGKLFELVPPGGYWRDIDPEIAKAYMKSCWDMEGGRTGILRRMSLDEPSLTVLTSPSQKANRKMSSIGSKTVYSTRECKMSNISR